MVSSTPRPQFTAGKDPVPIVQEAGWAPGPFWTGGKSRPHWDWIPDRPARSSVTIPTELPYNPLAECSTVAIPTELPYNPLAECSLVAIPTELPYNPFAECSSVAIPTELPYNPLAECCSVTIPTELPYKQHAEVKPHEVDFKNMENIAYHFTLKIPSIMWIMAAENGIGFNMKACSNHLGLMRG